MNSYPVLRLKRWALVLIVASIFGASIRCLAGTPSLKISPASWSPVAVVQGSSWSAAFTVTGNSVFQGSVALTVSGLPAGVTASWSQDPISLTSGVGVSTLTLTASATAKVGSTEFFVTASGDGVSNYNAYNVQVLQAPGVQVAASHQSLSMWSMSTATLILTATPVGGVVAPANAAGASPAVSGLPAGISASWSSPAVSGSGAVSWTLTLAGSVYAVASSGTLTLSAQITDANSGNVYTASLPIPLTVSLKVPTLSFSPAVTHEPVIQGGSISDLFTFTGGGSFHGPLTLTVTGLPSSVAYSWSNPVSLSASSGTSTLTLAPSATLAAQWYQFTVTAAGDGLTVSNNYTLEVEPSSGVQVQLSSSAATIEPNGTVSLTVTATPINGIAVPSGAAGASAAIASALPAGVTASWSSPTVAGGAVVWTLTLAANGAAQTGASAVNLAVQITDATTGLVYSASPSFTLLTSLLANVSIGSTPGIGIPVDFLGLSHEWGQAQAQMGDAAVGVNAVYRQLLGNLTTYGSGQMNLRIGGESTDSITAQPTPSTVEPFVELAEATGAQFELSVNLGADNVQLAVNQASDYANQMPPGSLLGIEIGNEPDLFVENGYRQAGYSFQNYMGELNTWVENIIPVSNGVQIAGPDDAGYLFGTGPTMGATYLANLQTYLADESGALSMVTQHLYAASPQDNPAPDFLLTPRAATFGPSLYAPAVQAAQAYGIPFRMGEIGAVSDGGLAGVSNTFASALWAIDLMFNYANVGVAGVNWCASGGNYNDPFSFTTTTRHGTNTYALNFVSPIYSGLLFFQAALGDGAQLLPVALQTPANLTAWATAPAGRSPRVAIINKDEAQSGAVSITMPGYSQASVNWLTAPSYTSTSGITFDGQTMDGTTDGKLRGVKTVDTIEGSGGVFQISMPITSAALVVFTN